MKLIKLAFAGGVLLLAMTAHAHADFVFTPLTFILFSSPLGAILGPGAIYAGLQVAAYAAVLGAQFALSQRQQPKIDPGELKNTFQEAETPEYNGIGRVKVGGLKAFGNTKGSMISRLIWHLKGPMVAIEEYFVGGRSVSVDPDGQVQSVPWADEDGSFLVIKTKVGDGTETAWPELIADFPSLWTTAHRCRGVFQSLARFRVPNINTEWGNKKFQKLYQGGAPDIMLTARVTPVYDPRDPSQSADNASTWKWTDNGILCAAHIMRAYPDLTSADFDWAFIATEADRADAQVATLSGTEPRARCWGIWPSETRRGEVMQQVLDSIGAEVVLNEDGLIRIRLVDDAPTSEITLPALHIVELDWKSGPDAVERPNICRIKYYSPERGFDMGEINMSGIAWARIDDEVARYGEKVFDVDLPFCPSASQAQRISRRLFLQARADAGAIRTDQLGMATWDVSYATIRDDDGDEDMLCRIAAPRDNSQEGTVDIPYIVWPKALIDQPWNPPTMEAPPPLPAPDLQYESDIPTPAKPAAATVVQYPNNAWETRIRFTGVSGGDAAEAQYRIYTNSLPGLWTGMTSYQSGSSWYAYEPVNTNGEETDFRVRFSDNDDNLSNFSGILNRDPMTVDNSAPPAPSLNVETTTNPGPNTTTYDMTASTNALNAVRLVIRFNGSIVADENVRPGDVVEAQRTIPQADPTPSITAIAYTTNGTASPPATN